MMLLQRFGSYKTAIIIYLVLLVVAIVLTSQGCNSLTSRVWSENPMYLETSHFSNLSTYVSNKNPSEIYLELPTKNGIMKYILTKDSSRIGKDYNNEWLGIRDYASVKPVNRKHVSYTFLVFKNEFTINDTYTVDLEGQSWHSGFMMAKIETVDTKPANFTNELKIPHVQFKKYMPNKVTLFELIAKTLVTPLTLTLDIILIPVCYAFGLTALLLHFGT
jgi:hypothetical protein